MVLYMFVGSLLDLILPSSCEWRSQLDLLSPRAQRLERGRANKEPKKARKGLIREICDTKTANMYMHNVEGYF